MLKRDIAHVITASLVRGGDADGHGNVTVPFIAVTGIAEAAAEDILSLIEDIQERYYEERDERE